MNILKDLETVQQPAVNDGVKECPMCEGEGRVLINQQTGVEWKRCRCVKDRAPLENATAAETTRVVSDYIGLGLETDVDNDFGVVIKTKKLGFSDSSKETNRGVCLARLHSNTPTQ